MITVILKLGVELISSHPYSLAKCRQCFLYICVRKLLVLLAMPLIVILPTGTTITAAIGQTIILK